MGQHHQGNDGGEDGDCLHQRLRLRRNFPCTNSGRPKARRHARHVSGLLLCSAMLAVLLPSKIERVLNNPVRSCHLFYLLRYIFSRLFLCVYFLLIGMLVLKLHRRRVFRRLTANLSRHAFGMRCSRTATPPRLSSTPTRKLYSNEEKKIYIYISCSLSKTDKPVFLSCYYCTVYYCIVHFSFR